MVRMVKPQGPRPISLASAGRLPDDHGSFGQGRGSSRAWARIRGLVLKRDQYQCQPCKREGRLTPAVEVDHIIPKAEGGTDSLGNLQGICLDCHKAKTAEEARRGTARYMAAKQPKGLEPSAYPTHAPPAPIQGVGDTSQREGGRSELLDEDFGHPHRPRDCEKISPPANQSEPKQDGRKGNGGKREGAGRKPDPPGFREDEAFQTDDPDDFLRAVMRDPRSPMKDRMAAAMTLKKAGKGGPKVGKKELQMEEAHEVARGKLEPMPPPRPRFAVVK